jgi:hypothetical protein
MTHTPGPWTVFNGHIHAGGFEYLPTHRSGAPDTVWEANARLIAAAPDLLEAARYGANFATMYLVNLHSPEAMKQLAEQTREKISAAIAKAEGGK